MLSQIAALLPYTPPTNLLYGLREALRMLQEEGLANVFRRHDRHAEATRAAVRAWGLEIVCEEPREYSSSLTAVFLPEGHDADKLRAVILENFDMSLGAGLSKLAGKVFRIGHLGSFNDLMLAGTLCESKWACDWQACHTKKAESWQPSIPRASRQESRIRGRWGDRQLLSPFATTARYAAVTESGPFFGIRLAADDDSTSRSSAVRKFINRSTENPSRR